MSRFGWCMDGHHKACRVHITTQNDVIRRCECQCHTSTPDSQSGVHEKEK